MTEINWQGLPFDLADLWQARRRIQPYIWRTPLLFSNNLSQRTGCRVFLKMECWQMHGCFKVRGAVNLVSTLSPEARQCGLVTTSSGNHGTALAYAASLFGNPPTRIFLPENAEPTKVKKLQALGAEAVLVGKDYQEALANGTRFVKESGGTYAHSHGDPQVIAGQGSIGFEILEDLPNPDAVVIPVGGGGLLSGVSMAVRANNPRARVFGVEAAAAPGAYLSFRDGRCHETVDIRPGSAADGLMGTLTPLTFDISQRLVERIETVEEDQIVQAMQVFQQDEQIMIEGSAAVGLAALLNNKFDLQGKNVVLILTGRNINAAQFNKLISQQ